MSAFLTINGKDQEAKLSFAFEKLANSKHSQKTEDGEDMGGFRTIYMNLLELSTEHLVAFWECALAHKKETITTAQIEAALEQMIEEDGDTDRVFREAYNAIDDAAFFKKRARNFWKDLELMKEAGKTDEEREQYKQMYDRMTTARNDIKGISEDQEDQKELTTINS